MERRLIFYLLVSLCAVWAAALSCNNSGDDDDDASGVDFPSDDDTPDDDTWAGCDDDWDDDTYDDDTEEEYHPPVMSGGGWYPTELEVHDFNGIGYWYSNLYWSVCDLGNDLLGGDVYLYLTGTNQQFLPEQPINWTVFNNPPEIDLSAAGDCANPARVDLSVTFAVESEPPPAGDYCVDVESTDNSGSFSNLLEDLCVTMPAVE